jgi:hypothetical protein
MKEAKPVITFILLVVLCASVVCVGYDLVMRLEILSSLFSVFGLFVMEGALLRAPEGFEGENGFHVVAQALRAPHCFAVSGFPS